MKPHQQNEIDLMDVVRLVLKFKGIVAATIVVFTLGAIGVSYLVTPIYQSKALLSPVSMDGGSDDGLSNKIGGLASLVGLSGGSNSANSTTINLAIFKSQKFTQDFIQENNLLPIIYAGDWDQSNKTWKKKSPNILKATDYFNKKIRHVSTDKETGLITLSVNWSDPDLAVKWNQQLVARINTILRDRYSERQKIDLEFLKSQAAKTQDKDLRIVLFNLMQEEMKKAMLLNNRLEFAFKEIDPPRIMYDLISPKRILYVLFGGFLGGLVSLIIIYILNRRARQKVRPQDI